MPDREQCNQPVDDDSLLPLVTSAAAFRRIVRHGSIRPDPPSPRASSAERVSIGKYAVIGMIGSLILVLALSGCVDSSSQGPSSQEPIVGTWEHNDKDTYIWASIGADNQVRIYLFRKDLQKVGGETVQTVKKIGPNLYKLYTGDIEGLNITYLPGRDVWYPGSDPEFLYYRTTAKQPMPPTPAL